MWHNWCLSTGGLQMSAGVARYGALASSTIMFLGLLKLNLLGPGITPTVKQLWKNSPKQ